MEREEARMQAMRMRNEARRQRCMNARQRTIGVSSELLLTSKTRTHALSPIFKGWADYH